MCELLEQDFIVPVLKLFWGEDLQTIILVGFSFRNREEKV